MSEAIKNTLRRMPYGFYALTTRSEDDLNAMVVNWVTQISFEPQLVAVGLAKSAYSFQLVQRGQQTFALNLFLSEDAEAIKPFTKGRAKNPDKMVDANFQPAPETGCPILEGAAAYIEFQVRYLLDVGGDHAILVGEAINAAELKPGSVEDTLSLPDLGWSYAG